MAAEDLLPWHEALHAPRTRDRLLLAHKTASGSEPG